MSGLVRRSHASLSVFLNFVGEHLERYPLNFCITVDEVIGKLSSALKVPKVVTYTPREHDNVGKGETCLFNFDLPFTPQTVEVVLIKRD